MPVEDLDLEQRGLLIVEAVRELEKAAKLLSFLKDFKDPAEVPNNVPEKDCRNCPFNVPPELDGYGGLVGGCQASTEHGMTLCPFEILNAVVEMLEKQDGESLDG